MGLLVYSSDCLFPLGHLNVALLKIFNESVCAAWPGTVTKLTHPHPSPLNKW